MAKTYMDSAKYLIRTEFEIDGLVDKPDIVGAVFGQSEGLLGEEMDLKELQKAGKIGRIEIDFRHEQGKTVGEILTPSSMDMVQTSLLAATFESVDKVGPCDAKFATKNIDDVRSAKRTEITSRAQELLKKFKMEIPAAQELETTVREQTRAAAVKSYGRDKLPGGPSIDAEQELILVEGRADVINLLRNNIKNSLGVGGAKISKDVVRLGRGKIVTAFVDGDRGGELNARKLADMMPIDYVAQAPDGKEVEELVSKEIMVALRKRSPPKEFFASKEYVPQRSFAARRPEGTSAEGKQPEQVYGGSKYTAEPTTEVDSWKDLSAPVGLRGPGRPSFRDRPQRGRFGARRDGGEWFGADSFEPRPPGGGFRSGPREGMDRRGPREPREYSGDRGPHEDSDVSSPREPREYSGDREPRGYSDRREPRRDFGGRGMRPYRGGIDDRRDDRRDDRMDRMPRRQGQFMPYLKPGLSARPYESGFHAAPRPSPEETSMFSPVMESVKGTLKAKLLDEGMKEILEADVRDLLKSIEDSKGVHAVVFDGIITQRLANAAEAKSVKYLVGIRKAKVEPTQVTKLVVLG